MLVLGQYTQRSLLLLMSNITGIEWQQYKSCQQIMTTELGSNAKKKAKPLKGLAFMHTRKFTHTHTHTFSHTPLAEKWKWIENKSHTDENVLHKKVREKKNPKNFFDVVTNKHSSLCLYYYVHCALCVRVFFSPFFLSHSFVLSDLDLFIEAIHSHVQKPSDYKSTFLLSLLHKNTIMHSLFLFCALFLLTDWWSV